MRNYISMIFLILSACGGEYDQAMGAYELMFGTQSQYRGNIFINRKNIIIQFEVPDDLANITLAIEKDGELIEPIMVCALTEQFKIIGCSTESSYLQDYIENFTDQGLVTMAFRYPNEVGVSPFNSIKMHVRTNLGDETVAIPMVKKKHDIKPI